MTVKQNTSANKNGGHMKHELLYLNFFLHKFCYEKLASLFRPRVHIIIVLLFFSATISAQEQTSQEFPIGAYFNSQTRTDPDYYNLFDSTGMDWIVQYAGSNTQGYVSPYNLMADNADASTDYIMYYSTAWYSKWEAEEDQEDINKVGVKHSAGEVANWIDGNDTVSCWSTTGIATTKNKIVYGPHYHQEKLYKRWWYQPPESRYTRLKYIPRFRMALANRGNYLENDPICNIYVVVRHCWVDENNHWGENLDDTLKGPITLYASDFPSDSSFKDFYLGSPDSNWYQYRTEFRDNPYDNKISAPENLGRHWTDLYGGQGVQFCVDWLRNDDKYTLYIDYIEVYDDEGWNEYLNPQTQNQVITNIQTYAQNFSDWSNLKYWMGHSEPFSIDAYTPIKTVDAIIDSAFTGGILPRLMTTFYPYWETLINNDVHLERYYNSVIPEKLMIDFYPFLAGYTSARFDDWEFFRQQLQIASELQPGFYYWAQAFGYHQGDNWLIWRQPDSTELKAQTMLALTHGVKGIIYMAFDAYENYESQYGPYIHEGIIDTGKHPTELYSVLKNNIVPRLKGKLGTSLMKLDYTGDYLQLQREENEESATPVEEDYLTLSPGIPEDLVYNWHCGLFIDSTAFDDKYFLLTNMITTNEKNIRVKVQTPSSYPINYRFRNVEGLFDTTVQAPNYLLKQITYPPGEGYLYEFAPVIKYGGRLLYDETISNTTTLLDEMTIEDDAVLTVNSTFNVDKAITIKDNGSIITTSGGTMKFYNDLNLVIEGSATISGTPQHKLILDFVSPADSNGIIIKPGGSITISYCEIKNAGTGIFSELNADSLIVENVDFVDCEDNSISIAGRSGEEDAPPIRIDNCTIENSAYGISVNNSELYCTHFPCVWCLKSILQVGIKKVHYVFTPYKEHPILNEYKEKYSLSPSYFLKQEIPNLIIEIKE